MINKILIPVLISILVGVTMYHYKGFFDQNHAIYYEQIGSRSISVADRSYNSSSFSIHNETEHKIENIVIHGVSNKEIINFFMGIKSDKSIVSGEKYEEEGGDFKISLPEIKGGDTIHYEIFIETEGLANLNYKFYTDNSTIPNGTSVFRSYSAHIYILISGFLLLIFSYVAILLSFYVKWSNSIFPGFFKSRSEGGFALLHSGATKEATEYFENLQKTGRGLSVYDLSNLAVCYALEGDVTKSRNYIQAAKLGAYNKNLTIIRLCEFIVNYCSNNFENGEEIVNIKGLPKKYVDSSFLIGKISNNELGMK